MNEVSWQEGLRRVALLRDAFDRVMRRAEQGRRERAATLRLLRRRAELARRDRQWDVLAAVDALVLAIERGEHLGGE